MVFRKKEKRGKRLALDMEPKIGRARKSIRRRRGEKKQSPMDSLERKSFGVSIDAHKQRPKMVLECRRMTGRWRWKRQGVTGYTPCHAVIKPIHG